MLLHREAIELIKYWSNQTSFGLQGFPWLPVKNRKSKSQTDPSEYLNYKIAVEAAEKLKVKEIWFNTGTFSSKYTQDKNKTISVDFKTRAIIFDNVLTEAMKIQSKGYKIWINIFSEDKSDTPEQTDWSYWKSLSEFDKSEVTVLKDFIAELNQSNIGVSLYDTVKPTTSQ